MVHLGEINGQCFLYRTVTDSTMNPTCLRHQIAVHHPKCANVQREAKHSGRAGIHLLTQEVRVEVFDVGIMTIVDNPKKEMCE